MQIMTNMRLGFETQETLFKTKKLLLFVLGQSSCQSDRVTTFFMPQVNSRLKLEVNSVVEFSPINLSYWFAAGPE